MLASTIDTLEYQHGVISKATSSIKNDKSILRLTKKDLYKAAVVACEAYMEEDLCKYFFPDEQSRYKKLFALMRFRLQTQFNFCTITSNKIEGLSLWERANEHSGLISLREIFLGVSLLISIGPKSLWKIFCFQLYMFKLKSKLIRGPYCYFDLVVVHPDHRRKRLAYMLLSQTIEQVDLAGEQVYLETQNPTLVHFYHKLGFEVIHESKLPGTSIDNICMLRKGKK